MALASANATSRGRIAGKRLVIFKAVALAALAAWMSHGFSAFTALTGVATRSAPSQRGRLLKRQAGMCQVPGDVKRNLMILIDGTPFQIMEFQSKKVGKGIAITKTKIRNVLTGAIIDKTLNSGAKYETCETEMKEATFSFYDEETGEFNFMDLETFETLGLGADILGPAGDFITDGMTVDIETFEGKALNLRFKGDLTAKIVDVHKSGRSDDTAIITLDNGVKKQGAGYLKVGDTVIINKETFNLGKRV
mmetsp:Transcript_61368/g.118349  ORF Transcript_61368/g.118349 Transcript_61368/m.118349 type:complete len:250 (+) Transcript_61368:59-808(+)